MVSRISIAVLVFCIVGCSSPQEEKILVDFDVYYELIKKQELQALPKDHFVELTVATRAEAELLKEEVHHIAHKLGRCGGYTEDTPEEIETFTKHLDKQKEIQRTTNIRSLSFELNKVDETKRALKNVSKDSLENTVRFLTSYPTRSARSATPNKPLEGFIKRINEELSEYKDRFSIRLLEHTRTNQGSIHVQIKGTDHADEVIVIGGHIDSIANGWFSNEAPGADDNASGSAIVYETLKALLTSGVKPSRTIDFYWYGAEEQGLIGSKEIAKDYANRGVDVIAAMQLDMVLFPGNGDVIGLTEDFTDPVVTAFVEQIVTTHLNLPVERYKCGYGCSDHASWNRNGFKTVYPFEATFRTHNRDIHTKRDVINDRLSFDHGLRFVKIATSFLIETSQTDIRFNSGS